MMSDKLEEIRREQIICTEKILLALATLADAFTSRGAGIAIRELAKELPAP